MRCAALQRKAEVMTKLPDSPANIAAFDAMARRLDAWPAAPKASPSAATRFFAFAGIDVSVGPTSLQVTAPGGGGGWSLDTTQLAGQPLLQAVASGILQGAGTLSAAGPGLAPPRLTPGPRHSHGALKITLSGSRWPGTDLAADFELVLSRDVIVSSDGEVDITESLSVSAGPLAFTYSGDAADLLAPLQGAVALPAGRVCALGAAGQLQFAGSGSQAGASFLPGRLGLQAQTAGAAVCSLLGFGDPLAGASLGLSLLAPGDPSSFADPPPLRSSLAIGRAGAWRVALPATSTPLGQLVPQADAFDHVVIEAGEAADPAAARHKAIFTAPDAAVAWQLGLGQGIVDSAGQPLALALSAAHQLHDLDASPPHVELWGFGTPASVWATSARLALQLGSSRPENELTIGLAFDGSAVSVLRAWLKIVGVVPPIGDAVAEVAGYVRYASLVPAGGTPDAGAGANWLRIGPLQAGETRLRLADVSFALLRPSDMLLLRLDYRGVALLGGDRGPALLQLAQPDQPGHLSVVLPPQHVSEHSVYVASPNTTLPGSPSSDEALLPPPLPSRLAEASRLAFLLPVGTAPIALDLDSLLAWQSFVPDIADAAAFGAGARPVPGTVLAPPGPEQTAIEIPYRLQLSPTGSAGWAHDGSAPADTATPIWHARLGLRKPLADGGFFVDERDTAGNLLARSLRAIAAADAGGGSPGAQPYENLVDASARNAIVACTGDFSQPDTTPLATRRLMLSALGGWLDTQGAWNNPGITLTGWRHRAALGRDVELRVARRGHLVPWGHRASWVRIAERRFGGPGVDPQLNTAYLIERDFIVVTQALCQYAGAASSANRGRDLPFSEIEITTLTTPALSRPDSFAIDTGAQGPKAFWVFAPDPAQGGSDRPFLFGLRQRDQESGGDGRGRVAETGAAAIFLEDSADPATAAAALAAVMAEYNQPKAALPAGVDPAALALLDLRHQMIALARPNQPGDTSLAVASLRFTTDRFTLDAPGAADPLADTLGLYPQVASAAVRLPGVQQLAQLAGDASVEIRYHPLFLAAANDFDADNPAEVFAQLAAPLPIAFGGDRANGIASPDLSITALSRKLGTVAGDSAKLFAQQQLAATFDPASYFPKPLDPSQAAPSLLGAIGLADVIAVATGADASLEAPSLVVDRSVPGQLTTRFDWRPRVQPVDDGLLSVSFQDAHALVLHAEQVVRADPASASALTSGSLSGITVDFGGFIRLSIASLAFSARDGHKPEVVLTMAPQDPLVLGPNLSFLQPLIEAASGLLGAGPSLDIDNGVVKAGYAIALPALGIGVFSLQNIAIAIGVSVPLRNEPVALRFSFAEKDHPFVLAIAFLGGGGFFAIEVDAHQVRSIELAVEAGAVVALDLGVASGSAHVMIGVYFHFTDGTSLVTGYVRAGGELTVLQVLSLHVELYLGLTYQDDGARRVIWGEASLMVDVSIAFVSKSVTLSMRREFEVGGASQAAPRRALAAAAQPHGVGELLSDADWRAYAAAFA